MHDDRPQIPVELFARYMARESTPAEDAEVERWLTADASRRRLLSRDGDRPSPYLASRDADWQALRARLASRRQRPIVRFSPDRRSRVGRWAVALAAAATLVLAVGLTMYRRTTGDAARETRVAYREHVTTRGQRAVMRLSDGSEVVLGADSRIRYPQSFGDGDRTIDLEGEAHFTVVPNPDRPFIVYTSHSATRVLGTVFTVKAFARDTVTRLVVTEGRVTFRSRSAPPESGVVLTRADLGTLDAAGRVAVEHNVDVDRYTSWTDGRLIFDLTPLGEVITEMERWYDIEITLTDPSLATERVRLAFDTESVDGAIRILAQTLNLTWKRAGQRVTLSPAR